MTERQPVTAVTIAQLQFPANNHKNRPRLSLFKRG